MKETIPDRNLDPHKGIKSVRNVNMWINTKDIFFNLK